MLAGNPLPNYVPIGISNQVIACLLACFCLKAFLNLFHIQELPANRLFLGEKWDHETLVFPSSYGVDDLIF